MSEILPIQQHNLSPRATFETVLRAQNPTEHEGTLQLIFEKNSDEKDLTPYVTFSLITKDEQLKPVFEQRSLQELLTKQTLDVQTIYPSQKQEFTLMGNVDPNIPKEFQEKELSFSIKVGIEFPDSVHVTTTPTSTALAKNALIKKLDSTADFSSPTPTIVPEASPQQTATSGEVLAQQTTNNNQFFLSFLTALLFLMVIIILLIELWPHRLKHPVRK